MKTHVSRLKTVLFTTLLLTACQKESTENQSESRLQSTALMHTETLSESFIDYEDANEAISSYLLSIDSFSTVQITSFFLDADAMRTLLLNTDIKEIKLFIGHQPDLVSSPPTGTYHAMNAGSNTLFAVGVDASLNYVLQDDVYVLNRVRACPINCNITGTSANSLIVP